MGKVLLTEKLPEEYRQYGMWAKSKERNSEALVETSQTLGARYLDHTISYSPVNHAFARLGMNGLIEEPSGDHIKWSHGGGQEKASNEGTDQGALPAVWWKVL